VDAEPRRPESVLVLVYSLDAKVLVLKRRAPFEFWQSVTGSLGHGETHSQAAARELREETGFAERSRLSYSGVARQFTIDPRWRSRYPAGVVENVEYEWHYVVDAPCDVQLAHEEHSAYRWLPVEDAIDTVWSWTNRDALSTLSMRWTASGT